MRQNRNGVTKLVMHVNEKLRVKFMKGEDKNKSETKKFRQLFLRMKNSLYIFKKDQLRRVVNKNGRTDQLKLEPRRAIRHILSVYRDVISIVK